MGTLTTIGWGALVALAQVLALEEQPALAPLGAPRSDGGAWNFLVVRADEMRAMSIGCYGDRYAFTPHLDRLAAEGVRYTRAISAEPVCTSFRTSFDVGYYTFATPNKNHLHPADVTIHDRLQEACYYTAHVGKWHKTPPSLQIQGHPHLVPAAILDGLDYHGGHERAHALVGPDAIYYENGINKKKSAKPWRPQKHVDLAIEQIDAAVAACKPFYVVVDLEPPHYPYDDIKKTQWDVFRPGDVPAHPNVPPEDVAAAEEDLAAYYSMAHAADDMVGQLVAHLADEGLLASTFVIFTSDHGAHLGAHGLLADEVQKKTPYREALEIPLIVRRPVGAQGIVDDHPVVPVDLSYMILATAGLEPDPDTHHFDHLPSGRLLMMDEEGNTPAGDWYGVIRSDGVKFARAELAGPGSTPGPWLLFDTAADPWEMNNLVGTGSPLEAEMERLLDTVAAAYGLTVPF
jgi:arylsulfatase A-like enzyme